MQHVCGQISSVITHRPRLYPQGQCNVSPCVNSEGREEKSRKKESRWLFIGNPPRACVSVWVCVCGCFTGTQGVEPLEISLGTTSTRRHEPPLPLIDFHTADLWSTVQNWHETILDPFKTRSVFHKRLFGNHKRSYVLRKFPRLRRRTFWR